MQQISSYSTPHLRIPVGDSRTNKPMFGFWSVSPQPDVKPERTLNAELGKIEHQLSKKLADFSKLIQQPETAAHPIACRVTSGTENTEMKECADSIDQRQQYSSLNESDQTRNEAGQLSRSGFIFRSALSAPAPLTDNPTKVTSRKIAPLMVTEHKGQYRFVELINTANAEQLKQYGFNIENNSQYLQTKTKLTHKYFYPGETFNATIKFGLMISPEGRELVAVKKCRSWLDDPTEPFNQSKFRKYLENELAMQEKAGKHAPKPYGIVFDQPRNNIPKAYLVMELIPGGSLEQQLRQKSIDWMNLAQRIVLAKKIAIALNHLHQLNIYHGDIKLGNMMIDWEGDDQASDTPNIRVLLIDYEHACALGEPLQSIDFVYQSISLYHAPEIYELCLENMDCEGNKTIENPQRADIYSLGIAICQLLGKFDQGETLDLWYEYYSQLSIQTSYLPSHFPALINQKIKKSHIPNKELQCLMLEMLKYDPKQRPTLETVINRLEQVLKMTEKQHRLISKEKCLVA